MRPPKASLSAGVALAGLMPALAAGAGVTVGVDVEAGGLSVAAPASLAFPSVRLIGGAVTVEADLGPVEVRDTRAGAPGWTLVAVASPFAGPLNVPLRSELQVASAQDGPVGLRAGTAGGLGAPRALAVAAEGFGRGSTRLSRRLRLTVPPDTPSGSFSARLTLTVS